MKIKVILISLLLLIVMIFSFGCTKLMDGLITPSDLEQESVQDKSLSPDGLLKVLIGFKDNPGAAEQALIKGVGGKIKYTYSLVPAIAASIPESAIEALRKNPNVTHVDLDIKVYAVDTELDNTWGVKRIGAGEVHSAYTGLGINVAVIDSGIDYTHLDLNANYAVGYDFANSDDDPMDDNGHGTHVAGTIAAEDNGEGVLGVAPDASLYALKVLGADGSGDYSDVIAALQWCVDNGIQITNNSYGSSSDPGILVKEAFDNAYVSGILHVAAAGNSGNAAGRGDNVIYPARYASVIAVAASDSNDKRANFSSTGSDVELIAPGVNINSTLLGGGYGNYSGTSMASPHVAGTAALVIAAGITDARGQLQRTAEDLGLSSNHQGHGLVRADLAVGAKQPVISYYTVSGTVIDGDNNSLGGATVSIEGTGKSAITGSDGTYSVADVEGGTYNITASKSGYSSQTKTVNVDADTSVYFALEKITEELQEMYVKSIGMTYKAAGPNRFVYTKVEIVSSGGTPVPGATVNLKMILPDTSEVFSSGNTASDGTVTFEIKSRLIGEYTSTVTELVKDGWIYDSPTNVETSDSIIVQ